MSKFFPQVLEEITSQNGANYRFDLYASDLTQTAVNTSQVFNIFTPARIGDVIKHVTLWLPEAFQNTADTAFNSDTVTIGDSGTANNLITATQVNANGSLATFPVNDTGSLPYVVPNPILVIQLTFNSMSGKVLANLNKGHLFVTFDIQKLITAAGLPQTSSGLT